MPRGVYHVLTEDDLRQKMKDLQERIDHMARRKKAFAELKAWLAKRGLNHIDVLAMYRMMKPKRADKPVKSRLPLQPVSQRSLKNVKRTADGKGFYVREGSIYRGDTKKIKFLSPDGQYVWGGLGRKPPWFDEHLKKGGAEEDLLLIKPHANGAQQPRA
jgi:DNA-binding protein H-NS